MTGWYYTTRQIAAGIGVSVETVVQWIRAGKVRATRVGAAGRWRVHESDLRAAIGLRLAGGTAPEPAGAAAE
jgi:excisionase family DNA binding protein